MMVTVRDATPADAGRLAELLGQLGYPSDPASIPERLRRMGEERQTLVVVAVLEGRIVGLAAGQVYHAIHADQPVAYLMALVVDENVRGAGAGRALVAHMEDWGRRNGSPKLSLPTGTWREAAHRFYEHLGFSKTGFRYSKSLD